VRLGDFEVHVMTAGGWRADGGSFFGVVPKVLWQKERPADQDNLIRCACVAVVIRHRGRVIVCETGIGTKLDEKLARRHRVWEPDGLLASLARREEWDFALAPDPRSRAAYFEEDLVPVADAGLLELVDGEAEVVPGLLVRKTGGHTPGHQLVIVRHSDELSCAVTGDLVAQRPHLRLPWIPAADLDVLRSIEEKAKLLEEASSHRWLLVLGHETEHPAGYLEPGGGWAPEPELDPS
jgi:hypothetical protein